MGSLLAAGLRLEKRRYVEELFAQPCCPRRGAPVEEEPRASWDCPWLAQAEEEVIKALQFLRARARADAVEDPALWLRRLLPTPWPWKTATQRSDEASETREVGYALVSERDGEMEELSLGLQPHQPCECAWPPGVARLAGSSTRIAQRSRA